MIRILTFITGFLGATGLSQFPEFSQQYLQRLAGAVDELHRVVADFDASAEGVGMSREQALQSLNGGEFQIARKADMERTIARSARLTDDLEALRAAPMAMRALQPQRFTDPEIAAAAWDDFKPAVPVTVTGFGFAGVGFVLGGALAWIGWRVLGWPFRRLRRGRAQPRRVDPPVVAQNSARGLAAIDIERLAAENISPRRVVAGNGQSQVAVIALQSGEQTSGQVSADGDMTIVVVDGAGVLRSQQTETPLAGGHMAIVPSGSIYEIASSGSTTLQIFTIEPRDARAGRLVANAGARR